MSTLSVWNTPFDAFFARPVRPARGGFVPAADVARDGQDAVIRLELPGVDVASDVTLEVTGHRLVVEGERRDERSSEDGRTSEVRYGSFRRSFGLPAHVGADAVSASYDAGVLTVRVAGVHVEPEARRIEIGTATPAPGSSEGEGEGEGGAQAA